MQKYRPIDMQTAGVQTADQSKWLCAPTQYSQYSSGDVGHWKQKKIHVHFRRSLQHYQNYKWKLAVFRKYEWTIPDISSISLSINGVAWKPAIVFYKYIVRPEPMFYKIVVWLKPWYMWAGLLYRYMYNICVHMYLTHLYQCIPNYQMISKLDTGRTKHESKLTKTRNVKKSRWHGLHDHA